MPDVTIIKGKMPKMPDAAHLKNAKADSDDQLPTAGQGSFEAQARKACRFGLSLLSSYPDNCVLSPRSISVSLAVLAQGASPEAREHISEILCIDPEMLERYTPPSPDWPNAFEEANAAWFDRQLNVRADFVKVVELEFDTAVNSFDASEPEKAAQVVNQWAAKKTRGTIPHVLGPDAFRPLAFILANAVYFKGVWEQEFDPEDTEDEAFYCSGDSKVNVRMMVKSDELLRYAETDDFQAVDLPYKGKDFWMTIFLPRETSAIENVVRRLREEAPAWLSGGFGEARGTLRLPRFEIRWENALNPALEKAGLGIVLNGKNSFPNVLEGPLTVPEIRQTAFIRVDEGGTEAAAVTDACLCCDFSPDEVPPFAMHVNRPFLFAIRHVDLPGPLFLGRVGNPSL